MTHKYLRARDADPSDRTLPPDVADIVASHLVVSKRKGGNDKTFNLASLRATALGFASVCKDFCRAYRQLQTEFDGVQQTHDLPFLGHSDGRDVVDMHPKQHFLLFYKGGRVVQELPPDPSDSGDQDDQDDPVLFEPSSLLFLRDTETAGKELFVYVIQSPICRWRLGGRFTPNMCASENQMKHFKGTVPDGYTACVACQLDTNEAIRVFCCRDAFSRMFEAERFLAPTFAQKSVRQSWFKSRDDDWLELPINGAVEEHKIHATLHTMASDTASEKVRKLSGKIGLVWNLTAERAAMIRDDDLAVFGSEVLDIFGLHATASELMLFSNVHPVDGYKIPKTLVPKSATYNERAEYVRTLVKQRAPSTSTALTLWNPLKARDSALNSRKRSTLAAGMLNATNSAGQLSSEHFTLDLRTEQARTGLIDARFEQPGCSLRGRCVDEGDDSADEDYNPESDQHSDDAIAEDDHDGESTGENQMIPEPDVVHPPDYVSSDEEGDSFYRHGFSVPRM
jgi:hypothetical protein